jgi:hypothetical protein
MVSSRVWFPMALRRRQWLVAGTVAAVSFALYQLWLLGAVDEAASIQVGRRDELQLDSSVDSHKATEAGRCRLELACKATSTCPWQLGLASLQRAAGAITTGLPFERVHSFVQRCSPDTRACTCLSEWFGGADLCTLPLAQDLWSLPAEGDCGGATWSGDEAPPAVVVGSGKLRRLPAGRHACERTMCDVVHARPATLPGAAVWVDAATIDSIKPYLPRPASHRHKIVAVHRDESFVRFPVLGTETEAPGAADYTLAVSFHQSNPYASGAHMRSTYVERAEAQLAAPGLPWAAKSQEHVAVWFARNCDGTASTRQSMVQELSKHMRVHSFGGCLASADVGSDGPPACSRYAAGAGAKGDEDKPCVMYHSLFYLALENTAETDYVTEKLWDALAYGAVPVYWGAPNVRELLPGANAAVLASDFASIAELAAYLARAAADPVLYEAHRAWKKAPPHTWQSGFRAAVANGFHGLMCDLCNKAAILRAEGAAT